MNNAIWEIYVILIYVPSLLIGVILSVLLLPIAVGWMWANILLNKTSKRIEKEVKDGK